MKIEIEITQEMVADVMKEFVGMIVKKVVANELSGWKVEQRVRDIFDEKFSATVTSGIESELLARNPEKMQQKIAGLVDETMRRRVAGRVVREEKAAQKKLEM